MLDVLVRKRADEEITVIIALMHVQRSVLASTLRRGGKILRQQLSFLVKFVPCSDID